ncbi:MAG: hypothetical protein IJT25_03130 [Clostridia bacterium]|nr:hypothetical protein [Clostridia bacterium]
MVFYFELAFVILCLTFSILLLVKFGRKKKTFVEISNPKLQGYRPIKTKEFE